jgi:hypothetical protein
MRQISDPGIDVRPWKLKFFLENDDDMNSVAAFEARAVSWVNRWQFSSKQKPRLRNPDLQQDDPQGPLSQVAFSVNLQ